MAFHYLALASVAIGICALFFLGFHYEGSANEESWAGDSRVNIPISNLHPEDLEMVAVPFPMADVVTMAEVYTNACSASPVAPPTLPSDSTRPAWLG